MIIHLIPCLIVALLFPVLAQPAPLVAWGIAATWMVWLPVRYSSSKC